MLLAGQALTTIDAQVVTLALPSLARDLGASASVLQLVVSGYTLAFAALLITGARLGDDYGHRRMYLGGLTGFTAASLACGLAPTSTFLIVMRLVQGAAAAMLVPQVLSVVQLRFSGAERARAIGLYAAVSSGAALVGVFLGGLLVAADPGGLGWRVVFLINLPVGAALLIAAPRVLDHTVGPHRRAGAPPRRLDVRGVAMLAAAMTAVTLPLILGHDQGWPRWMWISLAAGLAALPGFVVVQRRGAREGRTPMLDLKMLATPTVRLGLVGIFLTAVGFGAFFFTIVLFFQQGLGYSTLAAALMDLPEALGFALASLLWTRLPAPAYRWLPAVGLGVLAPFLLEMGLVADGGWTAPAGPVLLFVIGAAAGLGLSSLLGLTVATIDPAHASDASGVIATVFHVALVVGVATLGTLFLATAASGDAVRAGRAFLLTMIASALVITAALGCALRLARVAGETGTIRGGRHRRAVRFLL
ncbi:MAG: MFS transporter [Frankia sp.]